jgi:hypothetical protein
MLTVKKIVGLDLGTTLNWLGIYKTDLENKNRVSITNTGVRIVPL